MGDEFRHKNNAIDGCLQESEWQGVTFHIFNSQATGDILYASSNTQLSRLGIGATNKILTVIGGVPTWQSTLAGHTLTSPVINGTVTTTGLTLPAFTLDGTMDANSQALINVLDLDLGTASTTGTLWAMLTAANTGTAWLIKSRDTSDIHRARLGLSGGVDTAVWAWVNSTHTGFIATGDVNLYSGADLIVYSDAGSTEKARIDGATGDITTSGSLITTGNNQTGKFLTGSAGNTVFAFSGGNFDIRAGSGSASSQNVMRVTSAGDFGIGTNNPDTKLEILNAGNQLKLSFDGTDNAIFAVDTNGVLTITPSGAAVDFASKNLTSCGYITLKITDTDGTVEGQIWYDASEDKLKFKTAAGVETITSA